jgi:DNA-binding CsgD family transcriptional regulator
VDTNRREAGKVRAKRRGIRIAGVGSIQIGPYQFGRLNTLIAEESARSVGARYSQLTPREREVCSLLTQGLLNKQIGYSLGATESTIKKHRACVLEKLGVQSIAELVNTLELMKRKDRAEPRSSFSSLPPA